MMQIDINGVISEETSEGIDLRTNEEPILINLDSPGGSYWAGCEIYNKLINQTQPVEITVGVECFSIATIILQAATKRIGQETSLFLIHDPLQLLIGYYNPQELEAIKTDLEAIRENIINIYEKNLSINRDQILEYMQSEKIIHAQEALEIGLIDEITGKPTQAKTREKTSITNQTLQKIKTIQAKLEKKGKTMVNQNQTTTTTSSLNIDPNQITNLKADIINAIKDTIIENKKPLAPTLIDNKNKKQEDAYINFLKSKGTDIQIMNEVGLTTSAGGEYYIPETWYSSIIEQLSEENVFRSIGTVITTQTTTNIPLIGDVQAGWTNEGATYADATSINQGNTVLSAYKLTSSIRLTEEFLEDTTYDITSYILRAFTRAFADVEEQGILLGTGTNQPTAISTQLGTGTTATLDADALIDLVYSITRPYRSNASFVMNDTQIATVRKFKDNDGAYLWQPAYQQGEPERILGYPVYTHSQTDNNIYFGDFSYLTIGDRGTRTSRILTELYATQGYVGIVMKERFDAVITDKQAITYLTPSANGGGGGGGGN